MIEAATVFDDLSFERRLRAQSILLSKPLRAVRLLALNLRQSLQEYSGQLEGAEWRLSVVSKMIKRQIGKFNNKPILVEEFVTSLDCSLFYGLSSCEAIVSKLEGFAYSFNAATQELTTAVEKLQGILAEKSFKNLSQSYQQFLQKLHY